MKMNQQGDVLIYSVGSIPEGAKRVDPVNGRFVIAIGEATGHAHVIEARDGMELFEKDGVLYLRSAVAPPPLTHEEHGAQVLEEGITAFETVREKDHIEDLIRKVKD